MKKITALLLALMMLAGVLAGCGKPENTGKAGKLKVVTTIFPAYDWVRAILGDKADNAEVTMLCFAGVQKYGRNAGRAKGCSNIHGYLPCFTHAGSYQFAFFTVYLFYDKFYRLFVCVRYRDIQYGLRFFLQKLLNGCYHCLNFDLWIISLQISVIFHKRQ